MLCIIERDNSSMVVLLHYQISAQTIAVYGMSSDVSHCQIVLLSNNEHHGGHDPVPLMWFVWSKKNFERKWFVFKNTLPNHNASKKSGAETYFLKQTIQCKP